MQILCFALGITQILVFLDTNILGIPNAKFRDGGLSQREDPRQMFLRRSGIQTCIPPGVFMLVLGYTTQSILC